MPEQGKDAVEIRRYRPSDCKALTELFYQTVHTVNAKDYTQEQLDAWADGHPDLASWNASLLAHDTYVAVFHGVLAGFGDIDSSGYLDRLYVHKGCQRMGLGRLLCDRLEAICLAGCITAHASITAKPFFEKRGYHAIKEQQVERGGIRLTNFVMEYRRK